MKTDELQRYFEYIKGQPATIPAELQEKVKLLYKKMRPLNVDSGIPVGIRQYHGLYRLITACAKAHLRVEATQEDFDIVEDIVNASYKSMKMNLKTGTVMEQFTAPKKGDVALLVWAEVMDNDTQTVDKEEYITALKGRGFNDRKAGEEFEKIPKVYDNFLERWKKN
jgi:DNA replicative helicase MCM subunit Mcm2 (Cdc46/Mcm family)